MFHDKTNYATVGKGMSFCNKYRIAKELLAKGSNPMVNTMKMKQIIKDVYKINPDRAIIGEVREGKELMSIAQAMLEAPGGNWVSCLGIPSELPKEKIDG